MSLATAISLAVSICALIIAGLALTVSWRSHQHNVERDKRLEARSVAVTCEEVIGLQSIRSVYESDSSAGHATVQVRAVNTGHRPVEIRGVHFQATGGILAVMPIPLGDTPPKLLGDGESINVLVDKGKLDAAAAEQGVKITHAVVSDADANVYSAPYPAAD